MDTSVSTNGTTPHSQHTHKDVSELEELVGNIMSMRSEFLREMTDPRRDIYDECGFRHGYISPETFQTLHDEDAIANRVNECLPKEAWQTSPYVYETEDSETNTEFEQRWNALPQALKGEASWFASNEDEGNPVWSKCLQANIQARINRYGTIVLGFDDCKEGYGYDKPCLPAPNRKLLSMHPLPEILTPIAAYDTNPLSSRYGKPTAYNVTLYDPKETYLGMGVATQATRVHWTRVIHIPGQDGSNDVFSQPACRVVYNNLYSLQKIYGASGEGYWKQCFGTTIFKTIPQLGGNVKVERRKILDAYEQLQNGLQKAMVLMGMEAQQLSPQVIDPSPFVDKQIEAICIKLGIPVPVFKGYEIGEQASTNNTIEWNDVIRHYQSSHITVRIIAPLIDRLIWAGVLPQPQTGRYYIGWPEIEAQSPLEQSQVFAARMQGFATYASGGVEAIIPPVEMLTREAGYTDEEANAIIDSTVTSQNPTLTPAPTNPSTNVDDNLPIGEVIE